MTHAPVCAFALLFMVLGCGNDDPNKADPKKTDPTCAPGECTGPCEGPMCDEEEQPCGDQICADTESCSSCVADCGECPICGDGACDAGEDPATCSDDCVPAMPPPVLVDPYEGLVQRFASANATGGGDGSQADPWTIDEAIAQATAGQAVNFLAGTYQPTTGGIDVGNSGDGPAVADRIVFRPEPGTELHDVVIDLQGNGWLEPAQSWLTFDGQASRFRFINGGNIINAGYNGRARGFQMRNADIEGYTDSGTGNGGALRFNGDGNSFVPGTTSDMALVENVRVDWDTNVSGNTSALIIFRVPDLIVRNCELYGAGTTFYYKHGTDPNADPNHINLRFENTHVAGGTRNAVESQAGHALFRNMYMGDFFNDEGGTTHGDFVTWDHITVGWMGWGPYSGGGSIEGMYQNVLRNVVFLDQWALYQYGSFTLWAEPDSDYNLYATPTAVRIDGANYDLAGFQSYNGADANSLQGAAVFGVASPSSPADFALAPSSPGYGQANDGKDIGVEAGKVGVIPYQDTLPDVDEPFFASPLGGAWYGNSDFRQGSHIRHGFGAYEYRWLAGQSGAPDGGIARHAFAPTDDVTVELEFWTTPAMAGDAQLLVIKDTVADDFEHPAGGFAISLAPNDSGRFQVHGHNRDGDVQSWTMAASPDVYDGNIHRIRMHVHLNTLGQSDGIIRVWVDDMLYLYAGDVGGLRTESAQQLDQFVLGPSLSVATPAATDMSLFIANVRLFSRDW